MYTIHGSCSLAVKLVLDFSQEIDQCMSTPRNWRLSFMISCHPTNKLHLQWYCLEWWEVVWVVTFNAIAVLDLLPICPLYCFSFYFLFITMFTYINGFQTKCRDVGMVQCVSQTYLFLHWKTPLADKLQKHEGTTPCSNPGQLWVHLAFAFTIPTSGNITR